MIDEKTIYFKKNSKITKIIFSDEKIEEICVDYFQKTEGSIKIISNNKINSDLTARQYKSIKENLEEIKALVQ